MANDAQFRTHTRFVATRGVKEYRQSIGTWVQPDDVVLEIGCEWGTTTALIAPHCRRVLGTDISADCIEWARVLHPGIEFAVLDAFDLRAALALGATFDKVYIDMSGISGYRSLLDTIALLQAYASAMGPKAIVVKSGSLKHFASMCVPWRGQGEVNTE